MRNCEACGERIESTNKRKRFCDSKCRGRGHRGDSAPAVASVEPVEPPAVGLVSATERTLEQAGRLDTVVGQQAMALARRIASPNESGSGVAALSKELRAVMVEAMAGANVAADPLDELRKRRDSKRAG